MAKAHWEKLTAGVSNAVIDQGGSNKRKRNPSKDKPMTAAEFKRQFCNKAARLAAEKAVEVRFNVAHDPEATAKDKQRLRNTWVNPAANLRGWHKPEAARPCVVTRF